MNDNREEMFIFPLNATQLQLFYHMVSNPTQSLRSRTPDSSVKSQGYKMLVNYPIFENL